VLSGRRLRRINIRGAKRGRGMLFLSEGEYEEGRERGLERYFGTLRAGPGVETRGRT
jgi:hypothetical protein